MKKIVFITFGILLLFPQCDRIDNWWIIQGHEYDFNTLFTQKPNGNWLDDLSSHFTFADRVTFTKLGSAKADGEGKVTVYYTQYIQPDTIFYEDYYDRECGCFVKNWEVSPASTKTFTKTHAFIWHRKGDDSLTLNFIDRDPFLNKTGDAPFWDFISRTYEVKKEYRKEKTWAADVISLNGDKVKMSLKN